MKNLLVIEKLTKRFGQLVAVDDISLGVQKGEVLGFLGPNGAGKSTTMKMISGFLEPTSGLVEVAGYDVVKNPVEVKERIGYLPEGAPTYGVLQVFILPRGLLQLMLDLPHRLIRRQNGRVIGKVRQRDLLLAFLSFTDLQLRCLSFIL